MDDYDTLKQKILTTGHFTEGWLYDEWFDHMYTHHKHILVRMVL